MSRRALAILAALLVATVAFAAAAAGARGALVEVRVDTSTGAVIFDGTVETAPHQVDGGDASGAHPCDGGGAAPLPTATGALDDALRGAGITWHGGWDPSFRDFFIDRIGPYASAPPDQYWSLSVDGRFSSGGCLATLAEGAVVHFQYGSLFGEPGTPAPGPGSPTSGTPGAGTGSGSGSSTAPALATHAQVRGIAAGAASFLRRHRGGAGADWGRLALALRRGRGLEAAAAALLGERLEQQRNDGAIGGDVNATATAVLALGGSQPRRARAAAGWLAGVQQPEGGFGFRPGLGGADVDTTALACWALARAQRGVAAHHAAAFVAAAQNQDGGFPSLPGGESNAQSTGLALVALRVAGSGPRLASSSGGATPLDYLASLARPDGSLEYAPGSHPTPVWTTAQALLGLSSRDRLGAHFSRIPRERRPTRAG